MRKWIILILVLASSCSNKSMDGGEANWLAEGHSFLQEAEVSLAAPVLTVDSLLFKKSALVDMSFGLEGAKILYTVNEGEEQEYDKPLIIEESCRIKIQSVKEGYQSSLEKELQLVKVGDKMKGAEIQVRPLPRKQYLAQGAQSLLDLQKGSYNFREGNKWLGFQSDEVVVEITLADATPIVQLYISSLTDHGAWVFSPAAFKVYVDDVLMLTEQVNPPAAAQSAALAMYPLQFSKPLKGTHIKIEIQNLKEIPEWHPGKGTRPWLFLDEIIIE